MKLTFSFVFALFLKWNELMRETSGKCMHHVSCWYLCMQIVSNHKRNTLQKFANSIFKLQSLKKYNKLCFNPLNASGQNVWKNPLTLHKYSN